MPAARRLNHYTSLGTLPKILEHHDIWLTDAEYCNDTTEVRHGRELTNDVVKDHSAKDRNGRFWQRLRRWRAQRKANRVYTSSFSEEDDDLSQWRAYGANGSGISLTLSPHPFYGLGAVRPSGTLSLQKVTYDDDEKRDIIRRVLDVGLSYRYDENENARLTAAALEFVAVSFKDDSFKAEREWRVVYSPPADLGESPPLCFRDGGRLLIPYLRLQDIVARRSDSTREEWERLPIRAVTLGPSLSNSLNKRSTKLLCERWGYPDVAIYRSEIPYRA
jgi:hypothetical protein